MTYDYHTVLGFGKYKSKTIKEVIEDDIDYLVWAMKNVDDFELSTRAFQILTLDLIRDRDIASNYGDEESDEYYDPFWD